MEDLAYNVASIEALVGYLLYQVNDFDGALPRLETACTVLWQQHRQWKVAVYDVSSAVQSFSLTHSLTHSLGMDELFCTAGGDLYFSA
jgi:hypothetical protein